MPTKTLQHLGTGPVTQYVKYITVYLGNPTTTGEYSYYEVLY